MGNNNTSLSIIDKIEHEIHKTSSLIQIVSDGFTCSLSSPHLICAESISGSLGYALESLSAIRGECLALFELNKVISDLEPHELVRLKSLARKKGETVLEFVGKMNDG